MSSRVTYRDGADSISPHESTCFPARPRVVAASFSSAPPPPCRRLGIVEGPLDDLDQILAAVGYQVAWSAANEAAMRQLVAARRRRRAGGPGRDPTDHARAAGSGPPPGRRLGEGLDELVGAAWICMRTFNPARGSRCIAAALIADADYRAFRSRWRRRCAGERPIGLAPEPPHEEPADAPAQLLADLFARASAAGIADDDIELVAARGGRGDVHRATGPGARRDDAHGPQPARPGHRSVTPACGGSVKLACRFSMKERMPS